MLGAVANVHIHKTPVFGRFCETWPAVYPGFPMSNSVKNILIVDDETDTRLALRLALSARGCAVQEARSPGEALDAVRAGSLDLVLIDLNMRDCDGIYLCRWIRAVSSVRIVTLFVSEAAKDDALLAGANDFIRKPFSIEELLSRIQVQ